MPLLNCSSRTFFLFGFIVIALLLAFAAYLQTVQGLHACVLCMIQRLLFAAMGVFFLLAALHNPGGVGQKIYAAIIAAIGLLGALVAARHLWIENLPKEQVPPCAPGWDFVLENFPLADIFRIALQGSAECAEVSWRFLGLSLAAWSLISFIFLSSLVFYRMLNKKLTCN